MMRWSLVLALLALGGCDEKKDTAAPSVAAPVSGAATAPSGGAASGAAATPSGAAASGAAATPSGAAASGHTAKPATASGAKAAPQPTGMMPHGSVEEGTLKYNPPPAQNPSGATTKKAPAKP